MATFERSARWVGDLDHSFYNDERQRFIWYEGSAIGFQMMLIAHYLVAGLILLIAGHPALWYVLAMLAPTSITTLVVVSYCAAKGAQYFPDRGDFTRSRGVVAIGAVLLLAAGLIRALPSRGSDDAPADGFWGGFTSVTDWLGFALGLGLALGVGMAIAAAFRQRHRRDGLDDDGRDDDAGDDSDDDLA